MLTRIIALCIHNVLFPWTHLGADRHLRPEENRRKRDSESYLLLLIGAASHFRDLNSLTPTPIGITFQQPKRSCRREKGGNCMKNLKYPSNLLVRQTPIISTSGRTRGSLPFANIQGAPCLNQPFRRLLIENKNYYCIMFHNAVFPCQRIP
eukprot:sb/3473522/